MFGRESERITNDQNFGCTETFESNEIVLLVSGDLFGAIFCGAVKLGKISSKDFTVNTRNTKYQ
jgi:hypothetical protein